jgi:hypothetical protein
VWWRYLEMWYADTAWFVSDTSCNMRVGLLGMTRVVVVTKAGD